VEVSQLSVFAEPLTVNQILATSHYLGPIGRGEPYQDAAGVLVFANPSSRHLPQREWIELVRWCITDRTPNAGSQQWARVARWLRETRPDVTTVVSYSDPSQGHTGALYRACNWLWAPTWHRLREPPSGNGAWTKGKRQAVKDRWIFPLRDDEGREGLLAIQDASIVKRFPFAQYRERRGGDYKRWRSPRDLDVLVGDAEGVTTKLDAPSVSEGS
jgi:hypothetical protein